MLKLSTKDQNVWFTSDTHFGHRNITWGESCWDDRDKNCRKFDTVKEMSQHIVKQINTNVKHNDFLFHLGDWSFGGIENIWNFRKQINCKNIHLMFGNHDHHIIDNKHVPNALHDFENGMIVDGDIKDSIEVYKSFYDYTDKVNAQQLFSSTQHYLEVQIDGRMLCLMHYPIAKWNNRHKDSWMLFGHEHGRFDNGIKSLDVGVDNAKKLLKEYRPFNFKEIQTILSKKQCQNH